ncbi:peptidoglycan DD-metalloendopeptidase family protein [Gallaecimonas kandeliae]|uniref:murein hydrolase activator EnvC family protein n=1 Tax=Gallaecimonas kandeliae TaxID=3029055 RepID=UPI002649787F|nr:peptidoglycan DD-metalloendopeptidase family protein [Gallaecimonas kandeliae]WKE65477.1 peptidoglycan DD-metalloendopeptidase family protein [Gallaecimonas kandeliae]
MRLKVRHLLTLAALMAASCCWAAGDKDKLKAVDSQINQARAALAKQKAERDRLQGALKAIDLEVGKLSRDLSDLQGQQADQQQRRQALQQKLDQLQERSKAQQALLVKQLRAAYATGQDDYLKMLLNLQSLADMERMMGYYQYLNGARLDELKQIKATRSELESTKADLDQSLAKLDALGQQIQERQASLGSQQAKQKATVDKLNQQIRSQSSQLEQMLANRDALDKLVKEAERQAKIQAGQQSLKGREGQLAWPVKGSVQALFGKRRAAGIDWKGVIINAPGGSKVRALAGGTVVYADWVRGFGLLMVVQHKDGYMSLYGQNQALLKGVGDPVAAGEPIALVGNSGGQNEPGLYFEIRHEGQAVNPARWCR